MLAVSPIIGVPNVAFLSVVYHHWYVSLPSDSFVTFAVKVFPTLISPFISIDTAPVVLAIVNVASVVFPA